MEGCLLYNSRTNTALRVLVIQQQQYRLVIFLDVAGNTSDNNCSSLRHLSSDIFSCERSPTARDDILLVSLLHNPMALCVFCRAGYGAALEPSAPGAWVGRRSDRVPLDRDLSHGQQQLLRERGRRRARGEGERFQSKCLLYAIKGTGYCCNYDSSTSHSRIHEKGQSERGVRFHSTVL